MRNVCTKYLTHIFTERVLRIPLVMGLLWMEPRVLVVSDFSVGKSRIGGHQGHTHTHKEHHFE